jgi:hypothetical protein
VRRWLWRRKKTKQNNDRNPTWLLFQDSWHAELGNEMNCRFPSLDSRINFDRAYHVYSFHCTQTLLASAKDPERKPKKWSMDACWIWSRESFRFASNLGQVKVKNVARVVVTRQCSSKLNLLLRKIGLGWLRPDIAPLQKEWCATQIAIRSVSSRPVCTLVCASWD